MEQLLEEAEEAEEAVVIFGINLLHRKYLVFNFVLAEVAEEEALVLMVVLEVLEAQPRGLVTLMNPVRVDRQEHHRLVALGVRHKGLTLTPEEALVALGEDEEIQVQQVAVVLALLHRKEAQPQDPVVRVVVPERI
jgi:hypothetical protein